MTTAMPHLTNLRLLFYPANHHPVVTASPLFLSRLRYKPSSKLSSSFSIFFKPKAQFPLQPAHRINTPADNKLPLLFNLCASYSKRTRSNSSYSRSPSSRIKHRRSNSSLSGSDRKNNNTKQKGGVAMDFEEGSDSSISVEPNVGFNRKRALGRDKNDTAKKNLQLKVRKLNPVNTICYVQILGTGMDTQDTSPSVLLFFDKQRFIFNAGEGLQRFCTEHKIKLSKIDHIFFSRVCSETAGGLPGLLLTLAGMGDEGMSVNIWGPSDLEYLVGAMRSFIPNAAMVHTHCFGPASNSKGDRSPSSANVDNPLVLVDDEVVKLSAILLRSSCSKVNHLLDSEATLKPGDLSVIYICELPEIKGKFDPKKAIALGLKPGPKYRELQLGNSVKSDRQDIMVHPDDVMGPSLPGPIVILVDCPTLSHLKHLLSLQALTDYYTDAPNNSSHHACKLVNCVIHLSPSHVTSTSEYQEWMTRFSEAQHIMAGHEAKNIEVPILKSSARIAARLNYLCPQFFPAPGFWSLQHLKNIPTGLRSLSEGILSKSSERILAENLLKFHLRPYAQLGLDRSMVPDRTSHKEIIDELVLELPEIKDASQQVNQLMLGYGNPIKEEISERAGKMFIEEPWLHENAVASCLENITREDMEIVLLGTGSSQPSKYRNVSSIFINLFSKGSVLFDCGEGTLGQLKRRFGVHGGDDAVRGLRCIWISHIHADHHTGLARILTLRRDLLKGVPHEPLVVVGPRQLKRFLDAYQRLEDLDIQFLDCRHTTADELDAFERTSDYSASSGPMNNVNEKDANLSRLMDEKIDATLFAKGNCMQSVWKRPGSPVDNAIVYPILKSLMKELREAGLESLISFPVIHCPQSFGVVLKAADRVNSSGKTIPGWKIAYSGDTRPCPDLVKASHGATVLIHEATFEDSMIEEAVSRNHSTTAEAIEAGDSAGAYRIILTHFSQRYPKIPVFDESHMHKTCIAFDMMSVNLADLPLLPKVLPYVKMLFRDELIVDESDDVVNVDTAFA